MTANHPALPNHRPLAVAHRGGNSLDAARDALAYGADLLEADVWPRLGQLEIRHIKTIGPLPIYWEKWYIDSIGGQQLRLRQLVTGLPGDTRLFFDLKGWDPRLGKRLVLAIREADVDRPIILCGRNWRQLDAVRDRDNIHIFYSVGEPDELAKVWPKLERQANPAISIHHRLLTDETIARLRDLEATIIAWTVNDPGIARTLFARGVDGFTSDNRTLLENIVRRREHAFDWSAAALPGEPTGLEEA